MNIHIILYSTSSDSAPSLLLRNSEGDLIAHGEHIGNGWSAQINRKLGAGTYNLEVSMPTIETTSQRYRLGFSASRNECTILGPVSEGLVFDEQTVRVEDQSSYRVRGSISSANGRKVSYYTICSDSLSIPDEVRDRALFTAAMQRVYLESFVRGLPKSGSWWDPTGWTDSKRFEEWLAKWGSHVWRRADVFSN